MRSGKHSPLWQAFDEAEFSASNRLNLRESLPTVADARHRAEQWLRERQVSQVRRVLVITGRGNNSPGGVSPVRSGVESLLSLLRRRGVVKDWEEHSPGSFVVSLAPISALFEAPRRRRDRNEGVAATAKLSLEGLDSSTLDLLRRLAQRSLEALGAQTPDKFIDDEMLSKFSTLVGGFEPGTLSEERLRAAITAALEQLDE